MTYRCGSLLPSASADVRSADDVIAFKGIREQRLSETMKALEDKFKEAMGSSSRSRHSGAHGTANPRDRLRAVMTSAHTLAAQFLEADQGKVTKRCGQCQEVLSKSDMHCQWCHVTFAQGDITPAVFRAHVEQCAAEAPAAARADPPPLAKELLLIKAALQDFDAAVNPQSFKDEWDFGRRTTWTHKVKVAETAFELEALTMELVTMIKPATLKPGWFAWPELAAFRENKSWRVPKPLPPSLSISGAAIVAAEVAAAEAAGGARRPAVKASGRETVGDTFRANGGSGSGSGGGGGSGGTGEAKVLAGMQAVGSTTAEPIHGDSNAAGSDDGEGGADADVEACAARDLHPSDDGVAAQQFSTSSMKADTVPQPSNSAAGAAPSPARAAVADGAANVAATAMAVGTAVAEAAASAKLPLFLSSSSFSSSSAPALRYNGASANANPAGPGPVAAAAMVTNDCKPRLFPQLVPYSHKCAAVWHAWSVKLE